MIDNTYKIKILGIVEYYNYNGKDIKKYDFERDVFIETHGKIFKLKTNSNLKGVYNAKEKEIKQMVFEDKLNTNGKVYNKYFLIGDLEKKELKKVNYYDNVKDDEIEPILDIYSADRNLENLSFLYNEDICLVYEEDKLIDTIIKDNFKKCKQEEIFFENIKEIEK